MIAYHGTDEYNVIKKFKKSKSGSLGAGLIYFSKDKETAYEYAVKYRGYGKLYTVELNVNNTLIIPPNMEPLDYVVTQNTAQKRRALNTNYCYWIKESDYNKFKKQGCDSVIFRNEVCVFTNDVIRILSVEEVGIF